MLAGPVERIVKGGGRSVLAANSVREMDTLLSAPAGRGIRGPGSARRRGELIGDEEIGFRLRGEGGGGGGRRDVWPLSSDAELDDRKCCGIGCGSSASVSIVD